MDDLMSAVDSVPNSAADNAFVAAVVFGLCFFLAFVVFLAPVREP
jgi:hypothetical protein